MRRRPKKDGLPGTPRPQFMPARLLIRVQRGGWGPVGADPARLVRVFYPSRERSELLVGGLVVATYTPKKPADA